MREVIITANVDQRRSPGLGRGRAFGSVRKDLASDFEPLAEGVFHQERPVPVATIANLRHDGFTASAVQEPRSEILLQPEGNLIPNPSDAQSLVIIPGRYFEHRESADLGNVLRFLDEGDFCTEFHVGVAEGGGAAAAGGVNRVVRRVDAAKGRYEVKLEPGKGAPVELKRRTYGVDFRRRAVQAPENVELEMLIINRHGVIGLERWALRPEAGS